MRPIRTEKYDGIYAAPEGKEKEIGGLPFYRQISPHVKGAVEVCSVWEPTQEERDRIAQGDNLLVIQIGEPIRPMGIELTELGSIKTSAKS